MKKLCVMLIAVTFFALNSQGQTEPNSTKKNGCFKISSLSISSGSNSYRTFDRNNHDNEHGFDFNNSSNGKHGMNSDNMGFMMGSRNNNGDSRKLLNLEMGLTPYSKKLGAYNKKRELVIGLWYSGSDLANKRTEHFSTTPGDTFTFNSIVYHSDTVARTIRSYREEANVLGASVQYLYKTDPEKRFSLFTGYGITAGYAITARIYKSYSKDSTIALSLNNTRPSYDVFRDGTMLGTEEIRTEMNADPTILTSVFVPFGINFRISKTKEVWNQMNLFIKGNVGMEARVVVGGKTHFDPYSGGSMGFKFSFK
ncbi:MAG: hypothetical protein WCM76_06270 [Bacteroidota bacterium]